MRRETAFWLATITGALMVMMAAVFALVQSNGTAAATDGSRTGAASAPGR